MSQSQLMSIDRFFVNQKAKLFELSTEFQILDESGVQIGAIRQEGQSTARKVLRALTKFDQFLTHRLSVYNAAGEKVLELTRPGAVLKSKVQVTDGTGTQVGTIVQQNLFGKIKFGLEGAGSEPLGSINAENWRAWNFSMQDASGREVGRITKKWAGTAKEIFTTADNYMVEIDPSVTGPMRHLFVAAAAGIDLALKQTEK